MTQQLFDPFWQQWCSDSRVVVECAQKITNMMALDDTAGAILSRWTVLGKVTHHGSFIFSHLDQLLCGEQRNGACFTVFVIIGPGAVNTVNGLFSSSPLVKKLLLGGLLIYQLCLS